MVNIFHAKQRRNQRPWRSAIFDIQVMRVSALHIAHHIGNRLLRRSLKDPMAVVVHEAPTVNAHLVHGGVFAHVSDGLLEVFGVAMNPLAAIAALGDGVELFETEVTWFSHQRRLAPHGPKLV